MIDSSKKISPKDELEFPFAPDKWAEAKEGGGAATSQNGGQKISRPKSAKTGRAGREEKITLDRLVHLICEEIRTM